MPIRSKSNRVTEYGDFQTPTFLARNVCQVLARRRIEPGAIIEPTCGIGNFLLAALDQFPKVKKALGVDVNAAYIRDVRSRLADRPDKKKVQTIQGSFFDADWSSLLRDLPEPLLVIGNPPWVTNTELGTLGSSNLPKKSNFKKHAGFDALTGKSNFDISEWMLLQVLDWLDGRNAVMAMLCKTVVARKLLSHAWRHNVALGNSSMYLINAAESFGASVDACLLVCEFSPASCSRESSVYSSIAADMPSQVIGYRDGELIADVDAYNRWKHLRGGETYRWRSGVKHDCAKVMELHKEGGRYRNGFRELVDLEDEYVYPMLKGSEVANARTEKPKRWMLVTQRRIGEDTSTIRERAPKTWTYLQSHADRLNRRASSIYQNRPPFSVFGVGDYSFAPWKVALPGLYKRLKFRIVGSFRGKPIVLDDTCYSVSCETREEALYIANLLNSPPAREYLSAYIFWDAKRPITVEILRKLDLLALARELGSEQTISEFLVLKRKNAVAEDEAQVTQLGLF